jgi:hypothetical protein
MWEGKQARGGGGGNVAPISLGECEEYTRGTDDGSSRGSTRSNDRWRGRPCPAAFDVLNNMHLLVRNDLFLPGEKDFRFALFVGLRSASS